MNKYDDIINFSRPKSKHPKMTLEQRSAQFAPFSALTGYEGQIKETARLTDKRLELDEEAKQIIANGTKYYIEVANMPTTEEALNFLIDRKEVIVAPSKAVNAGGVCVSGLEMSQNSQRLSWTAEEVDEKLHNAMINIHKHSVEAAEKYGLGYDLVAGANIAGFEKVVFIIKKENEQAFREAIGDRLSKQIEVAYVFQELDNLPEGYTVPEGRVKPWGTGHAVLSCIDEIDGPFAVINADDYYGVHAFKMAYDFLTSEQEKEDVYHYMMVGYRLENTLTENGHVARGVCVTDEEGHLIKINERTHIEKHDGGTAYTEDDGKSWTMLPEGSIVSMNMWGFSNSILKELKERFTAFLDDAIKNNPMKGEYFLPFVVDELLQEKKATVKVLKSEDKWYGVTYKEDKPMVMTAIQNLKDQGLYPQKLWEEA